jgi:competence protein ComEA
MPSNFDELFQKYRWFLLILLAGLILIVLGIILFKSNLLVPSTKVEVLNDTTVSQSFGTISVEIAGAVITPGVYELSGEARVNDLVISAGGFTGNADRTWTDKYLNRAAKLTDGQKIYIPKVNEQSGVLSAKTGGGYQTVSTDISSDSNTTININAASLSELDTLPGIGPVYGQNIIDHRPYSNASELVSKGVLKSSVYEKIKDKVSVY